MKILFLLLASVILSSCYPVGAGNCGDDSPELAYARLLTESQLSQLYEGHTKFISGRKHGKHWSPRDSEPLPEEIRYLPVKTIRYHVKGHASYRLQGCLDHHVDLVVYEKNESGPARIEVHWNETPFKSEVLWQQ